eukprot:gene3800-4381_t
MFMIDTVVITEPDYIKLAFLDQAESFAPRFFRPSRMLTSGGFNMATTNGEYHKEMRGLFQTGITPLKIKKMEPFIKEEIQRLVDVFNVYAKTGEPVDPNELVKRTTLNVILTILFSQHFPHSDPESGEILETICLTMKLSPLLMPSDFIPFLRPYLEGRPKIFYETYQKLYRWTEAIVIKRIETFDVTTEPVDILENMLIQHQKGEISIKGIVTTCIDMIIAGADTSANTIIYLIIAMANYPKYQSQLREEINIKFNNGNISAHDRSSTPFTNAIIKETFRRYPVTPLGMPHQVEEDVVLAGYHIKKGSQIIQNIYASFLSPKVWEDPLAFNPARFLGENNPNANKYKLSFGTGPRNCIGMSLAETEMYLVVCTLFSKFTFTRTTDELLNEEGDYGLALTPKPFQVKVCLNE